MFLKTMKTSADDQIVAEMLMELDEHFRQLLAEALKFKILNDLTEIMDDAWVAVRSDAIQLCFE